MKKKGNITLFFVYMMAALVVVLIAAFFAPMGVMFNTEMYLAGQDIYERANESIADIDNATIRNSIIATVNSGYANAENNIEVNNAIFQYGWILVILVVGLVIFLYSRRLVEYGGGLT